MQSVPLRAVGYRRVSSQEQTEGHSLDAQTVHIENYVQSQGWSLVQIYTDAGISAKSTGRATKVMVEASISSGNRIGLLSTSSGATIYVSDSTISRNMIGFDPVGGGALVSFGNNRVIDNQGDYYPTLTTPLK